MRSTSSTVLLVLSIGLLLGACILCFIFGNLIGGSLAELSNSVWEYRVFMVIIGALIFSPFILIMLYLQMNSKR